MNLRVRPIGHSVTNGRDTPGLTEARGILADIAHHDDHDIARACEAVMALSDCWKERSFARDFLALLEVGGTLK